MAVLKATNLTKLYHGERGAVIVRAVDNFQLNIQSGEFVALMGPSGSGKSTLLNLLGAIDTPTAGEIEIGGQLLGALSGEALADFRRTHLGVIFQKHNLLDFLTLRENILLPMALDSRPPQDIEERLRLLAGRLEILDLLDRYPYEVSGGQEQRAAAVRALIHAPALVLADEPTGELDSHSARNLLQLMAGLNAEHGATILMATHDPGAARYGSRVIFVKDGRLYTEVRRGSDRQQFFHQILDVLASMGGDRPDPRYVRS